MPAVAPPARRRAAALAALGLLLLTAHAGGRLFNSGPTVTLTSPTAGSYAAGAPIGFTATAADSDGSVSRVDFYVDGARVYADASAPYAYTWTSPTAGSHAVKAVAVRSNRAARMSLPET